MSRTRIAYVVTARVELEVDLEEAHERQTIIAWIDAVVGDVLAERMDRGEIVDFTVHVKEAN